ncbi:MAG: transporter [Ignavibacteria bacterium]
MTKAYFGIQSLFIVIAFICTKPALSGPPYDTDDPEPVELHHWEFYLSSRPIHDDAGWSGTLPHVEVNYGAVENLQLHIIAPMGFYFPNEGSKKYGFGDAELGMKYRFLQESKSIPMIGTFPLVELPTGNQDKGLGSGKVQLYIPVWIQKSFGKWMTYGGGGYWINPGEGKKNWWYTGWQVQNQITKNLNIGVELYHMTPQDVAGSSETRFNVGLVFDFTEKHHLLISAGRGVQGPVKAQLYAGYQLTIGSSE